jgi:4-amino-4-deoxy-L-arabinose transferase-like glycosyltransferase
LAWRPVGCTAFITFVVLLGTASGYGYYRDELYFRLLGQQPSWGYHDLLGPATPLLARAATGLFGDSVWALRTPAALLLAVSVVLVSLLAREFGGGRGAQLLASIGTAVSVFPLMAGHVLLTSTLDLPLSLLVILFAVRALTRGDGRWWLACGGVIGVALYNKKLVLLLVLGIGVGLLVAGPRSVFRDRFLWLGALFASVLGAPTFVYEVLNGWPMLGIASGLVENNGADNRISFVPLQLLLLGPFLVPIWLAGAIALWRRPGWRPVRAVCAGSLVCAVLFLASGGRPDYMIPLLLALLAAGSVRAVDWLAGNTRRKTLLGAGLALNGVFAAITALPVLPQSLVAGTLLPSVDQIFADQTGWPELTAQVGAIYQHLPADERAHTVVVAANYGEAGALDRFGPLYRLPGVYSGHNQLYQYGPPPESATTVIAVGMKPVFTGALFTDCKEAARIGDDSADVVNGDVGEVIEVCRGPRAPWAELWPKFLHLN